MGLFADWVNDQEKAYLPSLKEAERRMRGTKYDKDLLQHYVMSNYLRDKYGVLPAATLGLGKELVDELKDISPWHSGSGFNMKDLSADMSGLLGTPLLEAYRTGMLTRK